MLDGCVTPDIVGTGLGAWPRRGIVASANTAAREEKISLKGEERVSRASSFEQGFSSFTLSFKEVFLFFLMYSPLTGI